MTQQQTIESQPEPQLEPQQETQLEPQPEAIGPKSLIFYQAVGLIQAVLRRNEDGSYFLEWHDRTWNAYLRKKILATVDTLLDQTLYWRVYPHTIHTENGFVVNRFTVVNQPIQPVIPIDGQFKLAGCWESLPRWQNEPVRQSFFSVYRNPDRDKRPPDKSFNQHYSLNWDEEPFIPGPGKLLPWHAILAKLQPDGVFDFIELTNGPLPAPDRIRHPNYDPNFARSKYTHNNTLSETDESNLEKTPRISPPPPIMKAGKKVMPKAPPKLSNGVVESAIGEPEE